MDSLWTKTAALPSFPTLTGEHKTDVLIIGGGLAGILCAYLLQEHGVQYTLIEANTLCSGVSGHTTAKITSQHGLIYNTLARRFSVETAQRYYRANEDAVAKYRALCREIDCDFEDKAAYVYARKNRSQLEQELAALDKIGAHASYVRDLPLPVETVGGIRFDRQGQFHPLKFAAGICKDLYAFEHTRARSYDGKHTVLTDHGKIRAEKIVVATHFPLFNKHGSYFLKLYQHRSYVLGLENGPQLPGMYVDEAGDGLSFRSYKDLLLLGGGSHRTGKQGGNWEELRSFAREHYPDAAVRYRWATQDCMPLDNMPYIGQYSPNTPDLFVATGFHKWGMTGAMTAAMMLADLLTGKPNDCVDVFSPSRSILHPQLFLNALESTRNLLTPTRPRCPHLGCALKWNAQEHSWDCPCHGSRFDARGTLLEGPANGNKKL